MKPAWLLLFFRLLGTSALALITPAFLLLAGLWLLSTESGLQAGLYGAEQLSGGQIRAKGAQGRLVGPLQLERLEIAQSPASGPPILLEHLNLDWQPLALLEGRIDLTRLHIGHLRLPRGDDEPLKLPADLRLPLSLSLRLASVEIARLSDADDTPLLNDLQASISSDGQHHELSRITARWHEARLEARARLMTAAPFHLAATLNAHLPAMQTGAAHLPPSKWQARLDGPLKDLRLDLEGQALTQGKAREPSLALQGKAHLTPFARQPLAALQLSASKLNPRAFSPQAPEALLAIQADLRPDETGALHGALHLSNEQPRPIDRHGLPLDELSTRLTLGWNSLPRRLKLDDLQLRSGNGQLRATMDLAWTDEHHPLPQGEAKLTLHRFNPALWHSTLRPFNLDGKLDLTSRPTQNLMQFSLRDGPLKLDGLLRHVQDSLFFDRLELRHGQAGFSGHGSLGLAARHPWKIQGKLAHFDPALFARLPPADLNAEVSANGTLKPKLAGMLALSLEPSQLAGEALRGKATLDFVGIDQPKALLQGNGTARASGQLDMTLGMSHLALQGSWGAPGDQLQIHLDAPDLARHRHLLPDSAPLAGSLRIDSLLAASPGTPQLTLSARANHLTIPGKLKIAALSLEGRLNTREFRLKASGREIAPAFVDSIPAKKNPPDNSPPPLIEQLELDLDGTREQHRLELSAHRAGLGLSVKMTGGLSLPDTGDWREAGWRGLLSQFSLNAGPQAASMLALLKNTTLQKPAELSINRHAIELKTTRLMLAGGQLDLLQTRWTPQTWLSRGEFRDLALPAGEAATIPTDTKTVTELRAAGQWQLAQSANGVLSGRVDARLPDLASLATAFNSGLTSAGALDVRLEVSGQREHPQFQGKIRGTGLAFGMPVYGLQLNNGLLDMRLEGERILLERLHFDAPHHPGERALNATGFSRPTRPGQLDIQGEILPWQQAAKLDFRLTKLPALQRRDRWLVVSGEGQLGQKDSLLRLSARLAADAGFISGLDSEQPQLAEDIVILGRKKPAPSSRLETDISLDLGERFHLRASGLKARLAGQINLRGNPLQATGSIAAREASFEAYGQQLTVERGIVNFQGPIDNPGLNVLASRPGGAVEAGVSITGTVRQPVVKLVSTPNVPDAEKLSWIVLGRAPDSGGTDTGILFAAAGSLLGGDKESLTTQLAQGLGFDEISVHGSSPGNTSTTQASNGQTGNGKGGYGLDNQVITVGKRLSSRAYLSYDQGLSAARGALKLSYALGRRLSIVTRAGDESAVDVFYNFSFD